MRNLFAPLGEFMEFQAVAETYLTELRTLGLV